MGVTELARFAGALGIVVGLIFLCALAARRGGLIPTGRAGRRTGRIGVVESVALDAKRRLVLVRRDDREHLVVLGPTGDLVVERGIPAPPVADGGVSVAATEPAP
jgi:flagellar protein FliO/FliZ